MPEALIFGKLIVAEKLGNWKLIRVCVLAVLSVLMVWLRLACLHITAETGYHDRNWDKTERIVTICEIEWGNLSTHECNGNVSWSPIWCINHENLSIRLYSYNVESTTNLVQRSWNCKTVAIITVDKQWRWSLLPNKGLDIYIYITQNRFPVMKSIWYDLYTIL